MSERIEETGTSGPGWATDKALGWLLTLTGLVGWGASATLVWERLNLYENPLHRTSCDVNPLVSCGTVMQTPQAELFGFPNPLIGIVGYALVVAFGVALLGGAHFSRWLWACIWVGVALAGVFLIWLWSQALFEIVKLCIYCMVAWAATIPMFLGLTGALVSRGTFGLSDGVRRFAREWTWVTVIVVYVAVTASVLAVFLPKFMAQ
ncbi:vitamin K epoxide reductase family protein [Kytococcus sedentarius]|uniref:vitamin K epoxide reductase family protein n=1 Tax=Kytococcus sedentarius TaxID=1276 RepID=UPI00384D883D